MWLAFAFSGPVLWAISTHFDKYLVERYFKHSNIAVLLLFTAFMRVLAMPFIALFEPTIFQLDRSSIVLIVLSGILYMGATLFYLRAAIRGSAQLAALWRANAAALLTINGSNESINLGGGLGSRYALMFAPLAIVQAIGSTTTVFVFLFGVALSLLFPHLARETLSFRDVVQKGAAAVLVAAGVALVTR